MKHNKGVVQRLSLELPENDLIEAVKLSSNLVASVLDSISFRRRIPLQVRHVEVRKLDSKKFFRRYQTMPYTPITLEEEDILEAPDIPRRLIPIIRLYREAISSTKPHYRLLCLYRIREGLQKIKRGNDKSLLSNDIKPSRPTYRIPENELTREQFPSLIGKKLTDFLEHVRANYRIPIAHIGLDEYYNLVLDPANVRTDHRIDRINAVLISIIWQMINDEWDLMRKHNLR